MTRYAPFLFIVPLLTYFLFYSIFNTNAAPKQAGGILMDPLWTTGIMTEFIETTDLIVTDLNNDAVNDLVSCSAGSFYVLNVAQDNKEYFPRHYSQRLSCRRVAVADGDMDGVPEIYVAAQESVSPTSRIVIYIYDGITFERETLFVATSDYLPITGLVVANVDNDTEMEIVLGRWDRTLVYSAVNGALEWDAVGFGGNGLAVANVDNDSPNEIIVRDTPGRILSAVTQSQEVTYPSGFGDAMDVGDVDGDNRAEVVFEDSNNLYALAVESQTIQLSITLSAGVEQIAVRDVQGDSRAEIVVGETQWGNISGFEGINGSLLWQFQNVIWGVSGLGVGDADNDGEKEILWTTVPIGGNGTLAIADPATETVEWTALDVEPRFYVDGGDIDADGTSELVIVNGSHHPQLTSDGALISVYDAETKALEWQVPIGGINGPFGYYARVTQLDDDSALEIVMAAERNYETRIVAFDGATQTMQWQSDVVSDFPFAFAVGNMDDDAATEIALGTDDLDTVKVVDPTGNTVLWESPSFGEDVRDIAIGDLDGNGTDELVILTLQNVYIYETSPFVERDRFMLFNIGSTILITNRDGVGAGELLLTAFTAETFNTSLYAYAGDDFDPLWQTYLGESIIYDMVAEDIDYDGISEFLIGGTVAGENYGDEPRTFLVIGEPTDTGYVPEYINDEDYWGTIFSMAFVDVEMDGTNELFFGTQSLAHLAQLVAPGTGPTPTPTHTPLPGSTPTFTPTPIATATHTPTVVNTATATATATTLPTMTATATATTAPSATATPMVTVTLSPTVTPSATQTPPAPKLYLPLIRYEPGGG